MAVTILAASLPDRLRAAWALLVAAALLIAAAVAGRTREKSGFLLMENGGYLLTESGDRFLLETG